MIPSLEAQVFLPIPTKKSPPPFHLLGQISVFLPNERLTLVLLEYHEAGLRTSFYLSPFLFSCQNQLLRTHARTNSYLLHY